MNYYIDLFSPETYEAFSRSSRTISGFRKQQQPYAERLKPGDRFVCYMTKLSRWIGVLEIESLFFVETTSIFYPTDDPFIIRFRVRPVVWLPRDKTLPIHAAGIWNSLSFTKGCEPSSPAWTGMLRRSLTRMSCEDGQLLERLLLQQVDGGTPYPIDDEKYRKLVAQRVRRADKTVPVTVPTDDDEEPTNEITDQAPIRESASIQALLAGIGEKMGFKIWIPRNDRSAVMREWSPHDGTLIEVLPLNYDDTTLQTIEQIDVLWLKGRAIARAFEIEHTTAIYSGILRMADLLALQPNMDIKLHIVAPDARKQKVFDEIRRPVFSLLDKAPLMECCTFISYDALRDLAKVRHLNHLSDSVLEEYAEEAE